MARYECKRCGAILNTGTLFGDGTFHLVVHDRVPFDEARQASGAGWADYFRLLEVEPTDVAELRSERQVIAPSRQTRSGVDSE